MLRNILVCLICLQFSHGSILTIDKAETKFLQLQVKIEFTISVTREDVQNDLNKLDNVLFHFRHKVDKDSSQLHRLVMEKNLEARSRRKTISHCVGGLKMLSKNLDLYSLHSCKEIPCYLQEAFVEAKNLSLSLTNKREDCLIYYRLRKDKILRCLKLVLFESERAQKQIFRKLYMLKKKVLDRGLTCIQNNFNTIIRELCMLSCQFEECVARECKPKHDRNKWTLDAPPLRPTGHVF